MSNKKISVIIPTKPDKDILPETLRALKNLDYPQDNIEIIITKGLNPSQQRNEAAKRAQGEILYFLDDDSLCPKHLFKEMVKEFSLDLKISSLGGPNIVPETDTFLQRSFALVLGSFFGTSKIRARYRRIGKRREASEYDLILCNLAFRKDIFQEVGGFDLRLYPNEENELFFRLKKKGYSQIYNPELFIWRSQPKSIFSYLAKIFHYAGGRVKQMSIETRPLDLLHFIPLVFVFYIILSFFLRGFFLAPFYIYVMMNLGFTSVIALREKQPLLITTLPILFFLTHFFYGLGLVFNLTLNVRTLNQSE